MAFGYHLVGLYHLELILIRRKKRMHFHEYQSIVRNLRMKFNKSIRNSLHLITCYLGKIVAPAELPMTSEMHAGSSSIRKDSL